MSIYKLYLTKAYRKFNFKFPEDKNLSKLYNRIYQVSYDSSLDFKFISKDIFKKRLNEKIIYTMRQNLANIFIYFRFKITNIPSTSSIKLLRSYGIKVNKSLCSILFCILKILIFLKSFIYMFSYLKSLTLNTKKNINSNGILIHDYIQMFHYKNEYLLKDSIEKLFDTEVAKFYFINKSVNNSENLKDIHPKTKINNFLKFIFRSIVMCFKVAFDDITKNSNSLFLLTEVIENIFYEINFKNYQYNCVLFSDISRNNKRLWFSSAENKELKIIYFAHSTNFVGSYPYSMFGDFVDPYFEFFNFKKILPIDKKIINIYQKKLKNKSQIFLDNKNLLNDINKFSTKFSENKKFISIFDVPFRYPYDYSKYNSTNFIYKKKYLFNFYNKIAEKHKNDNFVFIIKPKKFLNLKQRSDFLKILNSVFSSKRFYVISEINVLKLILKSHLSYSIPFTTTGFLSRIIGKKYYYINPDPNININNIYNDIKLLNG